MARKQRAVIVEDAGDLKKYRTEIPNMIDDSDLSVYAFRLYVHLKRVAGESGRCFQGTRTLADHCHMSVSSISKAKRELEEAGYITIVKGDAKKGESDTVRIVDLWGQNFAIYSAMSKDNEPVRTANTPVREANEPVPDTNTPVREANERKNHTKKEPIKKEPGEEGESANADASQPTEWQEFLENLCWVCNGHKRLSSLTESKKGQLVAEAARIRDLGYGTPELREWFATVWKADWRYRKHKERPKPSDVRSSIAAVKEEAPEGFDEGDRARPKQSAGADAVDAFFARLDQEGITIDG